MLFFVKVKDRQAPLERAKQHGNCIHGLGKKDLDLPSVVVRVCMCISPARERSKEIHIQQQPLPASWKQQKAPCGHVVKSDLHILLWKYALSARKGLGFAAKSLESADLSVVEE